MLFVKNTQLVLLLTFLILSISLNSFAQGNFEVGHVVTQGGDTLKGRILFKGGARTPTLTKVEFKDSWDANSQIFSATDISSYMVGNKKYRSAYCEIEVSSDELNLLSTSPNFELRKNNIFLEEIILGDRSLLRHIDKKGKSLFYFLENSEPKLLYYKKYRDPKSSNLVVLYNEAFLQQLNTHLGQEEVSMNYELEEIVKRFQKFYEIQGITPDYEQQELPTIVPVETSKLEQLSLIPNYQPGYIVRNNGDTIYGGLDYQDWARNPEFIRFKDSWLSDEISIYHTLEIASFGLDGVEYRGAIVERETSSQSVDDLSRNPSFFPVKDTVFLQVLVSGKKELLYLRDRLGLDHYYITTDNGYRLLRYKKYLSLPNTDDDNTRGSDKTYMKENTKFRGELRYYLNDCQKATKMVEKVQYAETSLINLYKSYYECVGAEYDVQSVENLSDGSNTFSPGSNKSTNTTKKSPNYSISKRSKSINHFGAVAGIPLMPEYPGTGFFIGLSHEVILARNRNRLSIYTEALYFKHKYTVSITSNSLSNGISTREVEEEITKLMIGSNVRYSLSTTGKVKPFINAGFSDTYEGWRFTAGGGFKLGKAHAEFRLYDTDGFKAILLGFRFK